MKNPALKLAIALSTLAVAVQAQTTFTDNFNVSNNYLTNGVAGTFWDGIYFGASEFPLGANGNAAGSTLIANANLSSNNAFTVQTTQTDWEGFGAASPDDGFFLFKIINGDFSAVVHIIGFDNGNFNTAGLQARGFDAQGSPAFGTEQYVSWSYFYDQFGIANYFRTCLNGVVTQRPVFEAPANTNRWIRLDRVGDTFYAFERGIPTDAWVQRDSQTRTDLTARPVQIGLMHATFNNGATPRTSMFEQFSLVASNLTSAAAPGSPSGLTITTNVDHDLVASWTPGSASDGSILVVWTGSATMKEAPVNGFTYNGNLNYGAGDSLAGTNYFVILSGAGSSATISNLIGGVTYNVAVFAFAGSGATRSYNHTAATASVVGGAAAISITFTTPSAPVVVGTARRLPVVVNFNNGTRLDVTAISAFTSSVPAVINVTTLGPGRMAVLTNGGPVNISATYQGFQSNVTVSSVVSLSLTHQYSFNGGSIGDTNATDSVGGASGIVRSDTSSGLDGGGHLVLSGVVSNFVELPADLFTNYGGVTIEVWGNDIGGVAGARFLDFGNDANHETRIAPLSGGGPQAGINDGSGLVTLTSANLPVNNEHQYVFVVRGSSRTAQLYIDGLRTVQNTNFTLTPEAVGSTANDWLGRSMGNVYLNGTINEVRTYNGPLDAFQIAVNSVTGPDLITNDPGACTSLTLNIPVNPIQQFQQEPTTVSGTFANVGTVNLSTSGKVTYTTSDPNIATIDVNGLIVANGPGVANIRAIAFGVTNTVPLTVTPVPPGITHRWSFNGDYSDSVGGSFYIATPHGNANIGLIANQVVLDGSGPANATTGTYVELPPNLLLGYSSIVFEMWETDQDQVNGWGRIFDFSSSTANYIFLTPLVGNNRPAFPYIMRTAFLLAGQTGGEETINIARPTTNAEHQIVYIIDATTLTGRLYVDGVLQLERNGTRQPKDLGPTPNDWLGRSPFGDPLWIGSINEFRLYNGTISDQQVLLNFLAGPDVVNSTGGGISGVSMALSNAPVGNLQLAHVLANYNSFGVQPVMGGSSNWVSSDLTVAKVDSKGNVYSVGAGTATISGTYNGLTAASNITVSASAPTLLHRYSFDGDATDSVGGANGTLQPGALVSGGVVNLTGATNSYVILPGHLLDGLDEVTIETWLTYSNGQAGNNRAWDFGDSITTNYLYFSPISPGNTVLRWAFETNPAPNSVGVPSGALVENRYLKSFRGDSAGIRTVHYIWTLSDRRGESDFYMNGDQDTFPYNWLQTSPTLSRLVNNETYLGHGSRTNPASPANLQGSINEFRIWRGAFNNIQARASFAAGPSNVVINPGAATTLAMTLNDSTMLVGAVQRPTVTGTFASIGTLDLTAGPDVILSSSDPTKVKVIGDGFGGDKIQAVAVGSANIIASYGGKSATNPVTVISSSTLRLAHRYSFNGSTADLVGHADAKLFGNAVLGSTAVTLDGSTVPTSYILLPGDLISGYDKATFELFGRFGANINGSFQRYWDFGNRNNGNGFNYLYYAPGQSRIGLPGQQGEFDLNSGAAANNTSLHSIMTVDSANGIIVLYTNGVLARGLTNRAVTLSLVNDVNSMLGRSQFGDPTLNGSIDEFRLYTGIMSAAQAAQSFAAGADPNRLTARTDGGSNVIITWPNTMLTEGFTLQYSTSLTPPVNWLSAGASTIVGNNNQVTIPITNSQSYFRLTK